MKKLVVFLLLSNILYSQEKGTTDYSIGTGLLSSIHLADIFHIKKPIGVDGVIVNSRIPPCNATFKYAIKKNWFLDADLVYEGTNDDLLNDKDVIIGKQTRSNYTFGIGTEYHYLSSEFVQLYSGISIGYALKKSKTTNRTENDSYFSPYFTLIGIRIGRKIALTIELGAGYKGISHLGLSYQP